MQALGGFCQEKQYPAIGRKDSCNAECEKVVQISESTPLFPLSREDDLLTLLEISPVGVAIAASLNSFQTYGGGVYDDPACIGMTVDHAVTLVGYGTDEKLGPYWLLKNTWSAAWGEKGYMRIARGKNMCSIASEGVTAKSGPASQFGMTPAPRQILRSAWRKGQRKAEPAGRRPTPATASTDAANCYPIVAGEKLTGTCMDVLSCQSVGGSVISGFCPNQANIQCCLSVSISSAKFSTGRKRVGGIEQRKTIAIPVAVPTANPTPTPSATPILPRRKL